VPYSGSFGYEFRPV